MVLTYIPSGKKRAPNNEVCFILNNLHGHIKNGEGKTQLVNFAFKSPGLFTKGDKIIFHYVRNMASILIE